MHMTLPADPGKLQRKKILISNLDLKLFLEAALQAWSCWVELVPPGSYTHICILLFPTGVRTLSYCLPCPRSLWPSSPRLFKNRDREGFPTVYGNPWLPLGFFNI